MGKDNEMFGIRLLAAAKKEKQLIDQKEFDFVLSESEEWNRMRLYEFSWNAFGKTIKLYMEPHRQQRSGRTGRGTGRNNNFS